MGTSQEPLEKMHSYNIMLINKPRFILAKKGLIVYAERSSTGSTDLDGHPDMNNLLKRKML